MRTCDHLGVESAIYTIDEFNPKIAKTKGRKPQMRKKGAGETSKRKRGARFTIQWQ